MNPRLRLLVTILVIAGLGVVAWLNNRPTRPAAPEPLAPPDSRGNTVGPPAASDPGITWTVPRSWLKEIAGTMRLATYIVPGASTGADAECAVYYFGPGAGGGVEPNLERWIGEFETHAEPQVVRRAVNGVPVAEIRMTGTFTGHTMRTDAEAAPRPSWGLLGAIVQGPKGDVFFKLTGPAATVSAATGPFDSLLASLRAE